MIRFDHISKQYGGNQFALDDVSVEIPDGDFVFLIGPSGAGKTTLLRLLIHDMTATSGTLMVDDWELNKLKNHQIHLLRRKVSMIFQDFKLLTDRTVFENVAIGMEILGKKKTEIRKGVDDILALVSLTDKKYMFPTQLSAGELQRTSIARAIIGGPKILLADEPTGNLDPQTAWEILNILEQVNKIGTTVVMATHNAMIVNELKKRTITLNKGKITNDEIKGKYHGSDKLKDHKSGKKEHGD